MFHNNKHGFSALELLLTLTLSLIMVVAILHYVGAKEQEHNGERVAYQAMDYAQAAKRYATTHYALLQQILTSEGQSNGDIATIPANILQQEGFLSTVYPVNNLLGQVPCIVFTWGNNSLQGFVYYRSNNTNQLAANSLIAGLQALGGAIGVYQDGVVSGAGHGWNLTLDETTALFIANGDADPSQGRNPDAYQCSGSNIANNSYVINLAMLFKLNNQLPQDSALHEYIDTVNPLDTAANANTMQQPLNMYYQAPNGQTTTNNLIFQMNSNCVMDPNNPATMQDYSPTGESDGPNPQGCRNRQLGLHASNNDDGTYTMTVTGFRQGGDPAAWGTANLPYVGELKAAFIQPTQSVNVTESCLVTEIGKMAQQAISSQYQVDNLYVGQLQCMINPLCPNYNFQNPTASPPCYMPINTISITYEGDLASNAWQLFSCPPGLAALVPIGEVSPSATPYIQQVGQAVPQPNFSPGGAGCSWYSWNNLDLNNVSTVFQCGPNANPTESQLIPGVCTSFYIVTTFHSWGQTWDFGGCSGPQVSTGGNYIVTCTNDTSKMVLPISVN